MDTDLRELERKWALSGSMADEAALLAARARAGVLDTLRLGLAAYLGHPASRTALEESAPLAPEDLHTWLMGLGPVPIAGREPVVPVTWRAPAYFYQTESSNHEQLEQAVATRAPWSQEAIIRVLIAVSRPEILAHLDRDPDEVDEDQATVVALSEWIRHPCQGHWDALTRLPIWDGADSSAEVASWLAQGRAKVLGEEAVREVIRREVVPWALGTSDAVLKPGATE